MFKHQTFFSRVTRSIVFAVAVGSFLTIAAGATSAAGFSVVDSVREFLGMGSSATATLASESPSALLLTEDFSYTAGSPLNGQGGWAAHSGAGTNPITVTSPGLTYAGYAGSGIGNAVTLGTSGEDDNVTFAPQTTGSVYAAAMVNVSSAQVNGDYFFHFFDGAIGTNIFRGRVFVKKDATAATYGFGLQFGSTANAVYTPTTFVTGTTHLVILKYTFVDGTNNDTVALFVDPALGGSEPAPTLTNADSGQSDIVNLDGVALRQGGSANAATEIVDGIRVGTAWSDIAGGSGTPNPSPTQSPGGTPTPTPTPTPSPTVTPSPVASPSPTVPPVPFTTGNVVMYRVGDSTAPLTNVATTVFLDEYTTAGTFVQSIRMPVEAAGANHILTASGTSSAEGMLTRSTDGHYIVLTGYDKAPGGTNPSQDPPTTTNRVIGRVAVTAAVDTTTALTDPTTSFRSTASTNGTDLWMTASGNGSRYTTLGMTTSTQLATTPTNLRATAIFGGQLYVSSATGTFQGISTVGTGLPTTAGQTITLLNGFPTAAGPSPMQFAFFDANTLYVADDRTLPNGGVQKWTQSGGLWTLTATFNNGLTAGVRGLTLTTNGSNQPLIYCTTADSLSKLVSLTDDGTASPAFNILATTAANTAWRGIAFVPTGGVVPTPTPSPSPTATVAATPSPTPTPTVAVTPTPTPTPGGVRTVFDFDGDHKTDISIWRSSAGQWWLNRSTDGVLGLSFGESSDIPRAADYTGDGKTDVAFFRPADSSWYVLRSDDFTYYAFPFGAAGDIPVTGDFDADGRADAGVYRPSVQTWFILRSSGGVLSVPFGLSGDVPVPADYDGDGRADVAIFRPSEGQWWILRSSDSQVFAATFGVSSDKPVPGDYTGDHKADIAFFRPAEGNWYVLRSEDITYYAFPWGGAADKPAPGDYDGDGVFDAAVFRPSDTVWYILGSTGGPHFEQFGLPNDTPVPGQSIP